LTLIFYLTVRMAKIKTQVTADVGEVVEKEKHSSIAGGIAAAGTALDISMAVSQKTGSIST
jgi:hypothetical protein